MALEDYDVQVLAIDPVPNTNQNPLTGQPIDPTGATLSKLVLTITDTSVTPPLVIKRSDLISTPDAESVKRYALGVIDVLEKSKSAQKRNGTPSPILGALDILPPAPPTPSTDDVAVQAFADIVLAWLLSVQKLRIALATQDDIDVAARSIRDAYTPSGTPVDPALATRFDQTFFSLVSGR